MSEEAEKEKVKITEPAPPAEEPTIKEFVEKMTKKYKLPPTERTFRFFDDPKKDRVGYSNKGEEDTPKERKQEQFVKDAQERDKRDAIKHRENLRKEGKLP